MKDTGERGARNTDGRNELPVFAVRVRRRAKKSLGDEMESGREQWRVLVRAPDAEGAQGNLAARGYEVVDAELFVASAELKTVPRMACLSCGYSFAGLTPMKNGVMQCPECGMGSAAFVPGEKGRSQLSRARVYGWRVFWVVQMMFFLYLLIRWLR